MKTKLKWKTLRFNGPAFLPYKRLPSGVSLLYNHRPVRPLSNSAEEAAVNYSTLLLAKNKNTKKRSFNTNFFNDFRALLTNPQRDVIIHFDRLNFNGIVAHLRQLRNNTTKRDKLRRKQRNLELKERHGFCMVDGVKVALGSWTVEPAGIFMGRPGNPSHGRIKLRIRPEQVTVNCSGACPPPRGHAWRRKLSDQSAPWVAKYTNNLGEHKYILFGNESKFRSSSDEAKFKAAQTLGSRIRRIRSTYERLISSRHEMDRQLGLAVYFIDRFSLRVGNEKGQDAADTVGCTTLRREHISIQRRRHQISFDFKGKDSIRFKKEFKVPAPVYSAIQRNLVTKKKKDDLFDLLNAQNVNDYLKEIGDKLTAKVFRTFNASENFQKDLLQMGRSSKLSLADKLFLYKKANLKVAKLCNHQKTVNKKAESRALERMELSIRKKKENLRLLKQKLARKFAVKKRGQMLNNEQLAKANESLKTVENNLWMRKNGTEFSLGTSQANYLDPRITVAWSKKNNVPLDKIWSATLRKKYSWAMKTSRNFRF